MNTKKFDRIVGNVYEIKRCLFCALAAFPLAFFMPEFPLAILCGMVFIANCIVVVKYFKEIDNIPPFTKEQIFEYQLRDVYNKFFISTIDGIFSRTVVCAALNLLALMWSLFPFPDAFVTYNRYFALSYAFLWCIYLYINGEKLVMLRRNVISGDREIPDFIFNN